MPINVIVQDGRTGIMFWDKLFNYLQHDINLYLASYIAEAVADCADKALAVVIACTLYKMLPKEIIEHYY